MDYNKLKIEFGVECLVKTKYHEVGKVYKAIKFAKENSWIYVMDERDYSYLTYNNLDNLEKKFKIV